ncbi:hypothetical protein SPRG_15037 [Saprolegnia parasitica CBS 223.65]|uniref:FYVE-type domain-containing protein n=1 Tax=Saprolegnia parasitica (strain CBS 223.65) TaxID=695850 RepID=A0A067BY72_SAPPC|nr:hypothetical protein SPRG_15037 [Saprolegnia parasitica CBS 223.65]KDO19256.1 hypothetical protein SPRG_15037 [Saprolegnia parasitica CBS 223.65]|eukprot:XP_012210030.1 hypothetical protein SPRG_15037 [Saprolegnia parasitica CBS 223.65]
MLELPVPNKFFPPVHLDDADELHLRRLAKDKLRLMTDLLYGRQTQTLSWTPCEGQTADGCHVLKAHFVDLEANSQRAHACVLYRASVVLQASVPEVMSVLAVPKTDDYRRMMKSVYGHDFLDGYCLHTLPRKKLHRPNYFYTSLKWCALAARNLQGGRGSDFCFLEYAGIRKESNSLLGFCIQQSVAMDGEVPDFGPYGLTRDAFLRTGILIAPTDRDGHVRVTSFCQVQSATIMGASGGADYEDVMRRRVTAIRGLQSYLERGRLGKLPFVERWRWVRDEDRKTCSVCMRNFMFRRRHHCRQCGEVVCASCAPYREVETPTAGPNRVRICNVCYARAHGVVHRPLSDSVLESSVYTDDGASLAPPPVTPQRLAYRRSSTSTVRSPVTRRTRSQRSASMGDLDDNDLDDGKDDDDNQAAPVRRLAHPRPLRDTFERAEPPSLEHAMAEITQRIKATQLAIQSSVSSREREMQRWPAMPPVPSPASSSSSSEPAPEDPPGHPYAFPLYDSSDVDDEASTASFKTSATDDTECPFAPQNYHQLLQQLQLSTADARDDLSDFHLELNVNHDLDDDDLAISEIGTEFLTMERPTPIVVDPPSKPPTSASRHLPPPMPASMKASLLARQAALRSSEAAMSTVSSSLWKEPTSAPLPPPPPSLPHASRRLRPTQSQSGPKAVWAPSPPPVAANAMRSQTAKLDESGGDIQASLAHRAFAQLEAECPSTPERIAILQALVTTFSSLLSHREESDFCVLNRSDHAFAAVLQAYPSTLKLLQLAGYAIYPQRCVLSDFDAFLLANLVGTLKRLLSDPQQRHSYYANQWSF